jgi:hypothetical protein
LFFGWRLRENSVKRKHKKMDALERALAAKDWTAAAQRIVALRKARAQRSIEQLVRRHCAGDCADALAAIDFCCRTVGCSPRSVLGPLAHTTDLLARLIWLAFYVDFFSGSQECDLCLVHLLEPPSDHYARVMGAARFEAARAIVEQRRADPVRQIRVVLQRDGADVRWEARLPSGFDPCGGISSSESWARSDSRRDILERVGVAADAVITHEWGLSQLE